MIKRPLSRRFFYGQEKIKEGLVFTNPSFIYISLHPYNGKLRLIGS